MAVVIRSCVLFIRRRFDTNTNQTENVFKNVFALDWHDEWFAFDPENSPDFPERAAMTIGHMIIMIWPERLSYNSIEWMFTNVIGERNMIS